MVDILAAIDGVDWSRLTHAYGSAKKTPEQLRAVLNGDARAVAELDVSLYRPSSRLTIVSSVGQGGPSRSERRSSSPNRLPFGN